MAGYLNPFESSKRIEIATVTPSRLVAADMRCRLATGVPDQAPNSMTQDQLKPRPLDPPRHDRIDIQVLRGFAILIVVLNHAKISFLSGGYLGVDIFFVISGFLITRMIGEKIAAGNFRFSEFYFARARRLLPSAYVTFLGVGLLAPFFLTSAEALAFKKQMWGAISFTANVALANQVGYFEQAAELKPLLHTWSLAVEEQYYLALPMTLVLVPARFWLRLALVTVVASATICFFVYRNDSPSAFYLMPSRLWELTAGSLCAFSGNGKGVNRIVRRLFWPALSCLWILPVIPIAPHQPGLETPLICAATMVVILVNHPALATGWVIRGLSAIGDRSYSFYLIHWPVIAIFNNLWIGKVDNDQPPGVLVALVALSFGLACLLTRYVENPVRQDGRRKPTMTAVACILAASASIVLLANNLETYSTKVTAKNYEFIRRINFGFDPACEFSQSFHPIPQCANDEKPEIMVWGDSFAMHLVPGLAGSTGAPAKIIQATRSFCGPIVGIAGQSGKLGIGQKWGESCIEFNDSVVQFLRQTDSVKIVVMSSPFSQYVDKAEHLLKRDPLSGRYSIVPAGLEEAVLAMKRTAETLRSLGKRVVVVAAPPASGFNIGRCLELLESGITPLGADVDCQVDRAAYQSEKRPVLEFLAAIPVGAAINVVTFDAFLCSASSCRTHDQGILIYRDIGHLSYEGSVFLANASSLLARIRKAAT